MARLLNIYPYMIKRTTQKFVWLNLWRVKVKQFACQDISDCSASQILIQEARSDQLWWSHQVLPQWYVHLVPHLDWELPGKYFLHKKLHSQVQTEKTTCIPTYAQNHNIKTGFDWICWEVLQFAQDIFFSLNLGKLKWGNLHYITTFRIITLSSCDDSHQVLPRSYVQLVAI